MEWGCAGDGRIVEGSRGGRSARRGEAPRFARTQGSQTDRTRHGGVGMVWIASPCPGSRDTSAVFLAYEHMGQEMMLRATCNEDPHPPTYGGPCEGTKTAGSGVAEQTWQAPLCDTGISERASRRGKHELTSEDLSNGG